jgi:TetR/AcrR family transcriptional repressor of lmrAB and yxaGH operons
MAAGTRARMIDAALAALQRQGVAGMSFTDVLNASGAARGAIYHHFPGGKAQLVTEAATRNGLDVRAGLAALPARGPRDVVDAFLATVRPVVEASATGDGCALAAVTASPGPDGDGLRQVAATTFASWVEALADRLAAAGEEPGEANDLAATLIALLEGALVLCRAAGSLEPFEQITRTVAGLIQCRYPRT